MKDRMHHIRDERKKAERRVARKHREAFVALLDEYKDRICENPGMKWSEFLDKFNIKDREEYQNLIGTKHSSQPYDLFGEMRSKWKHCDNDTCRSSPVDASHHDSSVHDSVMID
jgi:hypothetical protein